MFPRELSDCSRHLDAHFVWLYDCALILIVIYIQWNLSWETTTSQQIYTVQYNWSCHLFKRDNIFLVGWVVFQDRFHCIDTLTGTGVGNGVLNPLKGFKTDWAHQPPL